MKVFDFEQYSPAWWQVRRGVPSASNFNRIMTAKTMKPAAARWEYINQLIADTFREDYGAPVDEYVSAAMIRGQELEGDARSYYTLMTDTKLHQVGFCLHHDGYGCSPDALCGDDGGLECKSPEAKTHVGYMLNPSSLLADYAHQVHGCLIVTSRQWWDLMSYCPGFPEVLLRVTPDEYTDALRDCLDLFMPEYRRELERVRAVMPELVPTPTTTDEDAALSMFAGAGQSDRGGKPNYQSIAG